jgi:lysozyme family protein
MLSFWGILRAGRDAMLLSEIEDQNVANKLFDMGVNMGVRQAALYSQRAVNASAGNARITEDGVMGEKTLAAVNAADPVTYRQMLCELSATHYEHVAAANPAQAVNLKGWLARAEG